MELTKAPFMPERPPGKPATWFTEYHGPGTGITMKVLRTLYSAESAFQDITLVETEDFGRVLLLDGVIQTTERDEFIYHEMLVHVPMCAHPAPRNVLIIGGGDGGCVREALRHETVERVTLVEIDGMVVDCCREFLPGIAGKLDDPRVEIRIEDGVKFIEGREKAFDVIMVDSTDPVAMASPLTKTSFFRAAKRALAPGGLYAAQTQGPVFEGHMMGRITRRIRRVFPGASTYLANVPTYPGGIWSFALAPKSGKADARAKPRALPAGENTHYYSPEVHAAAFTHPPYVAEILK